MADEAPAPVVLEELEAATEPEVSASEPVDSAAPPPSVDTEELPRPATGAEQHDGINEKGNDAPPNGTVGEEVRLGSRKSPDATNREDREDREDGEEGEHDDAASHAEEDGPVASPYIATKVVRARVDDAEEDGVEEESFMWRRPLERASTTRILDHDEADTIAAQQAVDDSRRSPECEEPGLNISAASAVEKATEDSGTVVLDHEDSEQMSEGNAVKDITPREGTPDCDTDGLADLPEPSSDKAAEQIDGKREGKRLWKLTRGTTVKPMEGTKNILRGVIQAKRDQEKVSACVMRKGRTRRT